MSARHVEEQRHRGLTSTPQKQLRSGSKKPLKTSSALSPSLLKAGDAGDMERSTRDHHGHRGAVKDMMKLVERTPTTSSSSRYTASPSSSSAPSGAALGSSDRAPLRASQTSKFHSINTRGGSSRNTRHHQRHHIAFSGSPSSEKSAWEVPQLLSTETAVDPNGQRASAIYRMPQQSTRGGSSSLNAEAVGRPLPSATSPLRRRESHDHRTTSLAQRSTTASAPDISQKPGPGGRGASGAVGTSARDQPPISLVAKNEMPDPRPLAQADIPHSSTTRETVNGGGGGGSSSTNNSTSATPSGNSGSVLEKYRSRRASVVNAEEKGSSSTKVAGTGSDLSSPLCRGQGSVRVPVILEEAPASTKAVAPTAMESGAEDATASLLKASSSPKQSSTMIAQSNTPPTLAGTEVAAAVPVLTVAAPGSSRSPVKERHERGSAPHLRCIFTRSASFVRSQSATGSQQESMKLSAASSIPPPPAAAARGSSAAASSVVSSSGSGSSRPYAAFSAFQSLPEPRAWRGGEERRWSAPQASSATTLRNEVVASATFFRSSTAATCGNSFIHLDLNRDPRRRTTIALSSLGSGSRSAAQTYLERWRERQLARAQRSNTVATKETDQPLRPAEVATEPSSRHVDTTSENRLSRVDDDKIAMPSDTMERRSSASLKDHFTRSATVTSGILPEQTETSRRRSLRLPAAATEDSTARGSPLPARKPLLSPPPLTIASLAPGTAPVSQEEDTQCRAIATESHFPLRPLPSAAPKAVAPPPTWPLGKGPSPASVHRLSATEVSQPSEMPTENGEQLVDRQTPGCSNLCKAVLDRRDARRQQEGQQKQYRTSSCGSSGGDGGTAVELSTSPGSLLRQHGAEVNDSGAVSNATTARTTVLLVPHAQSQSTTPSADEAAILALSGSSHQAALAAAGAPSARSNTSSITSQKDNLPWRRAAAAAAAAQALRAKEEIKHEVVEPSSDSCGSSTASVRRRLPLRIAHEMLSTTTVPRIRGTAPVLALRSTSRSRSSRQRWSQKRSSRSGSRCGSTRHRNNSSTPNAKGKKPGAAKPENLPTGNTAASNTNGAPSKPSQQRGTGGAAEAQERNKPKDGAGARSSLGASAAATVSREPSPQGPQVTSFSSAPPEDLGLSPLPAVLPAPSTAAALSDISVNELDRLEESVMAMLRNYAATQSDNETPVAATAESSPMPHPSTRPASHSPSHRYGEGGGGSGAALKGKLHHGVGTSLRRKKSSLYSCCSSGDGRSELAEEDATYDPTILWCGDEDGTVVPPTCVPPLDLTGLYLPNAEEEDLSIYRIPLPTAVAAPEEAYSRLLHHLHTRNNTLSPDMITPKSNPDVATKDASDTGEAMELSLLSSSLPTREGTAAFAGVSPFMGERLHRLQPNRRWSKLQKSISGELQSLPVQTTGGEHSLSSQPTLQTSESEAPVDVSNTLKGHGRAEGAYGGSTVARAILFTDDSDALDGGRGLEREQRLMNRKERVQVLLLDCQEQRERKALLSDEQTIFLSIKELALTNQ